jgi:hypothetical protein
MKDAVGCRTAAARTAVITFSPFGCRVSAWLNEFDERAAHKTVIATEGHKRV